MKSYDLLAGDAAMDARFTGVLSQAISFICEKQLYDVDLWKLFIKQFTYPSDRDGRWRCEYWGKMMRGACFIYGTTQDEKLYRILQTTVNDLLSTQDSFGRFSTYPENQEFFAWDMWGRKYIMLGLFYFHGICRDGYLKERILTAVSLHADYICDRIGYGEGKIPVCHTSDFWLGVNSMSILEPFCLLYNLTGNTKYFDFAKEIVREGYEEAPCIFRLAEENKVDPYQYPEAKAYETMSCFEGLAEYYRITGEERYRNAVVNFGNRLLSTDVTVIGCCGCTHELFDHSSVTQSDDSFQNIMQETCVTVTLLKFCGQLLMLTGEMKYADCIETAFYNAYLGAFNTKGCSFTVPTGKANPKPITETLPFDSYSPLRSGVRGMEVGGRCIMENGTTYYGCCACIGSAGAGYLPKIAACRFDKGIFLSQYLPGNFFVRTPLGQRLGIRLDGSYPYDDKVKIKLLINDEEEFALDLRIPVWSEKTTVSVNGETKTVSPGRLSLIRKWKNGDEIFLQFDLKLSVSFFEQYGSNRYALFQYGCLVLAGDETLGFEPDNKIELCFDENQVPIFTRKAFENTNIGFEIITSKGILNLVDYASAGKNFGKRMAAFIPYRSK